MENPYHPPIDDEGELVVPPSRVTDFGVAHLTGALLGFALLIYSQATGKSGYHWSIKGTTTLSKEELVPLIEKDVWFQIEVFYRIWEGFLILVGAMFLVSGIALLCRTRWCVAISNATTALAVVSASAFLAVYLRRTIPNLEDLCATLGTSVRVLTQVAFIGGSIVVILYSAASLIFLNRPRVRAYLSRL